MIEIEHLSVRYGSVPALDDLSLRIERGSFVLVTGPSGCGKSTLALCLAGLIPHALPAEMEGAVRVGGLDARTNLPASMAVKIGLVFQNPATQLFNATVEEEIGFGPRNAGLPEEDIVTRVRSAAAATGLSELLGRSVRELSVGEQQLVAIASVLTLGPQVLVLDEPTANLDWRETERILSLLKRLQEGEGVTIVIIEHRLRAVAELADRVLLMREGRVEEDGSPAQVLHGASRLAALGMRDPCLDLVADSGQPVAVRRASRSNRDRPLVILEAIEAGYGRREVLRGLDLVIYPGEFVALVGDNGAGKSTLAHVIAGLHRPRKGRVTWNVGSRRLRGGRRVGLLFQNPLQQLVCDSVGQEVAFGPSNYGLPNHSDAQAILEAADLAGVRDRRPQALSAGQQQRTALAATMALQPCLLILDEPTMGQDWEHLSRLMDYLMELNRDGQAILLITHDDRLTCRYAGRRVVLRDGVALNGGSPEAGGRRGGLLARATWNGARGGDHDQG